MKRKLLKRGAMYATYYFTISGIGHNHYFSYTYVNHMMEIRLIYLYVERYDPKSLWLVAAESHNE